MTDKYYLYSNALKPVLTFRCQILRLVNKTLALSRPTHKFQQHVVGTRNDSLLIEPNCELNAERSLFVRSCHVIIIR